jgi:transcriptional regulator with XRE-family HTH domain
MDLEKKTKILKKLGEKLADLKKAQKLSYRKLAAKCDIDFADLKKYEKGVDIKFSTLIELAELYNINPKDLIDLEYEIDFAKSEDEK